MKAREKNFKLGKFYGGFIFYPYQIAFGISYQFLRCFGGRLLRFYFLCFKVWVNYNPANEGSKL